MKPTVSSSSFSNIIWLFQTVASGGWPQPEAPEAARFATLQEHYRTLAQREKLEKETRRFCGRKLSYMQLTDKYGLSAAVARKRAGLPPLHSLSLKSGQESVPGGGGSGGGVLVNLAPCQAKNIEEVEVLPIDELFGDTQVNMTQVCTTWTVIYVQWTLWKDYEGVFSRFLSLSTDFNKSTSEHSIMKAFYFCDSILRLFVKLMLGSKCT